MPAPRRRIFFLVIAAMLVIWLIALPRVARYPTVRRHIDRNRARQIQADAMFYTEVGPVEGITIEHRPGGIVVGTMRMAPDAPK